MEEESLIRKIYECKDENGFKIYFKTVIQTYQNKKNENFLINFYKTFEKYYETEEENHDEAKELLLMNFLLKIFEIITKTRESLQNHDLNTLVWLLLKISDNLKSKIENINEENYIKAQQIIQVLYQKFITLVTTNIKKIMNFTILISITNEIFYLYSLLIRLKTKMNEERMELLSLISNIIVLWFESGLKDVKIKNDEDIEILILITKSIIGHIEGMEFAPNILNMMIKIILWFYIKDNYNIFISYFKKINFGISEISNEKNIIEFILKYLLKNISENYSKLNVISDEKIFMDNIKINILYCNYLGNKKS
jgi:hypothetical protein